MPSGYTAALYEGEQDFRDFVLTTARGMGALIHMRDTSLDAEITLPEVSDYHPHQLEKAQAALKEYEGYSDEEWTALRDEEHERLMRSWLDSQKTALERRKRYDEMLYKVWAWLPPTDKHVSFKEYMIDQLTESKKFDCSTWNKPVLKSLEEYKEEKMGNALRDVSYHSNELIKERERVNERRKWIQALLDSLPDD